MLLNLKKYCKTSGKLFFPWLIPLFFLLFLAQRISAGENSKGDSLYFIKNNRKQYYDIFKPELINEHTKLLVFIDPRGNPEILVQKYKNLFIEFSCIGMCSCEIKDGPLQENLKMLHSLICHAQKKYSISEENIILSGFSGGSRMASGYASEHRGITKVIGCGSGFAPGKGNLSQTIPNYIGIVGTLDMNMTEMITNYKKSLEYPANHYLMIFPGTHEWPDYKYFRNAFIILNNRKEEMIKKVTRDEVEKIDYLQHKGLIMEAYFNCLSLNNYLKDFEIMPKTECQRKIDAKRANLLLEKEKKEIYLFTNAFDLIKANSQGLKVEKRSSDWWKTRIKEIQNNSKTSQDPELVYKSKRLLSFISWNAYEYAMILINFEGKYKFANEYLQIWSWASPESPLPYYMMARNYMKMNKIKKANKILKESQKRGINNVNMVKNDTLVSPIYHFSK